MPKLKLPSRNVMLFNGAAVLVVGASLAMVVRSMLFLESVPPCADRYVNATRFSIDRNGFPMATSDLQSRLGNTDWGLHDGARVVKLKSGPAKHALQIDMARAPSDALTTSADSRPGVGFTWSPKGLGQTQSACLSYSVFLPERFVFGKGGRLPGLMGATPESAEADQGPAFSTRFTWGPAGKADILAHLPAWPEGRSLAGSAGAFEIPRGRWVSLEQEIVLNGPGRKDGALRVWVDGSIVVNRSDMVFRTKPTVTFAGVLAESLAGEPPAGAKKGNQKIWLTPFELRWQ
ncbi:MAG: hypothetical protein SFW09_15750 [Hyphomicrobiaceae bacterium]|nr:hypothetical protein [Hyphomicrobiaceae bacterium]